LGGDRADLGLGPRDERADREELRLDGDAPPAPGGVAGDDRVRHPYVNSVRSSSSRSRRSAGTRTVDTSGRASAALISSAEAARATTGVPRSKASRSFASSRASSTSASLVSKAPSTTSSGTRRPVAPNHRSLKPSP